jgi:hypothetical protein
MGDRRKKDLEMVLVFLSGLTARLKSSSVLHTSHDCAAVGPAHFPPWRGSSGPRQREELSSDNSSNDETKN